MLVLRCLCAGLTLLALPCISSAQEENDAIVVTATRFPERRLDAPVGMTVITAADIARDTARSLPDLLSRLGGLYVRNNSGSPDYQVDLRGFGITGDQNTLVLLDGIRLNENDLSATKLSAIPLQSIERIEILRGSGSVLYGGGASGGTINIITRGPRAGAGKADLYGGFGTYGTADVRADLNLAGKQAGTLLSGSHYESDNYRANNRVTQDSATGDVRFEGGPGSLALKFGGDRQTLRLPGTRDEHQLVSDPRGTSTPDDWSARDGGFMTLLGRYKVGELEFAADASYRDELTKSDFVSFTSYAEARLHNLVFSPRVKWNTDALGLRSSLVLGTDVGEWHFDRNFSPGPTTIGSPIATTQAQQKSDATYAQLNTYVTEAMKLTFGYRTQRVDDHLLQTGFATSDQRHVRTPHAAEAGAQYALSSAWTVFGRLGTSFRVATVDENAFTASGDLLEPQTARNRDAGVEYRRAGRRLGMNVYRIDLDNEIYFSPLLPPFGFNTNLSPTYRQGAELFGTLPVSDALELSGNLVFQSAKFKYGNYGGVDVSGKDVPLVPRTLANARASWKIAPRTSLVASATYAGKQRYDNDQANTFPHLMPGYLLADLKLSHGYENWTFAGTINNLFDKRYYSYAIVDSFACATPVCAYPQAGRTLFASAQYAFK